MHLARYISNSKFTASCYERAFGVTSTVIPPLIDRSFYSTTSTRENVTFINPYAVKGVDLVIGIARLCPDIPFVFQESWSLNETYKDELVAQIEGLANVTLRPRTKDMTSVYGKARIVLAPSKWEEAWGRVASEAHCSGIPVIGSRRGGLPEAIGEGGIVLDYDAPLQDWADAVRLLWSDDAGYERLSTAARKFSERLEMNPEHQFAMFFAVLRQAAESRLPIGA